MTDTIDAEAVIAHADPAIPEVSDLEKERLRFAPFLDRHSYSTIESRPRADGELIEVAAPWGDKTLALVIPKDGDKATALAEVLNSVFLPQRLTAIWHPDKKALEIIWTAYRLAEGQAEISGRKFTFIYKGKKHVCHFTKSSPKLTRIAKYFRPLSPSPFTNHRNLGSYFRYSATSTLEERVSSGLGEPLSFWISNITWHDTQTIGLIEALNFYMSYFDEQSPLVLVQDPPTDEAAKNLRRTRYIKGKFPAEIISRNIDRNLVGFWLAALNGNSAMRFILYFRIIEYASHHYLDDKVRMDVKKLLSKPDFYEDLDDTINLIVGSCIPGKQDDVPKFKNVMRKCVSTDLLWNEIKQNFDFFKKETKFDGGFTVAALISGDEKASTFATNGTDRLADRLREIRNTLSHGRDQKTGKVISPTTRNFALLRPWIHLIGTSAAEVVLHEGLS